MPFPISARSHHPRLGTILIVLVMTVLHGCASDPSAVAGEQVDAFAVAPDDFTLDVLILPGEDRLDETLVHRRQGRFTLFPDGSLHSGIVSLDDADRLPPPTRLLDRADVARIWSLLEQSGVSTSATGQPPRDERDLAVDDDAIVTVLSVHANGDRWQVVRTMRDDTDDAVVAPIVRRLARLSWATDQPLSRRKIQPRRYHFGPDPYAQYRETSP